MNDLRPNIWRLQAKKDIVGLVEALRHEEPEIRRRAAAALRTLGAVEAIPALRDSRQHETDPKVRLDLTTALQGLEAEAAEDTEGKDIQLRQTVILLKSGTETQRIAAAKALGLLGDKRAVEPLVLIFHDTQQPGRLRLAAAQALVKLDSAPAVVTLLAAIDSTDWHIRRNACAVLGQLQADWATGAIADCLTDSHPVVRRTARAALKHIGTPDAQAALNAAPPEPSPPPHRPTLTRQRHDPTHKMRTR